MNSREIEKILKSDRNFIGCFAFDDLPDFPKKFPAKIIINTGSIKTKGDHWISMLLTSKECFYFDSFGLPIINHKILEYLRERYTTLAYSDVCIQDFASDMCGAFCIAFLKNVKDRKSYERFIESFSSYNMLENDNMMKNYLKTIK